jgi:Alpha/beta hydrolase domain
MSSAVSRILNGSIRTALGAFALILCAGGAQAEGPSVEKIPGNPVLLLSGFDLAPLGFTTEEFFISGTATSYKLAGPPPADGRWQAMPAGTAPYATRIVVVRPSDPKKFNGTVVVEWLNVTAGTDAAPDWNAAHRLIMREGYAYVGVSAQKVGVEGGNQAGPMNAQALPLKKANPERYGKLSHPGDEYSYDIYSQAGQLLKAPDASKLLGGLVPTRVIAMGESQSAARMVTYINAVDPIAKVYDGYLVHSRFGSASPLEGGANPMGVTTPGVKFRPDLRVPVITVITETDLMGGGISGYQAARQPDYAKLRVWEVPGTAHADNYTFGAGFMDSGSTPLDKLAAGYEPMSKLANLNMQLAKPINNAPQHHYVVEAALWSLEQWIGSGKTPPKGKPMQLAKGAKPGDPPSLVLDKNGNVKDGVRTPWVDVPIARLSGVGDPSNFIGRLAGSCEPFDAAALDKLYGSKSAYLKKFEASLNSAIKAGFILPADKQEALDLAGALYHGSH